jgi:hypothetical protein
VPSLSDLQDWRGALLEARFSGTRRVEHGDKTIEYKSDAEMAAALADVDRRIAEIEGTRITEVRVSGSKGL